jgi:HAD superfamily hydrolase (TIGR01549 family)
MLDQIRTLLKERKFREAFNLCSSLLEASPSLAEAHKLKGNSLQGLGDLPRAKEAYRNAIQIKPDYVEVYVNLGGLAAAQNEGSAAEQYFRQAIHVDPSFAGAYRNLARLLQQAGAEKDAVELWFKALELEPDAVPIELHHGLAQALSSQGQWSRSIATWRSLAKRDVAYQVQALDKIAEASQKLGQRQGIQMNQGKVGQVNRRSSEAAARQLGRDTLAAANGNGNGSSGDGVRSQVSQGGMLKVEVDGEALYFLAQAYCDRRQWAEAVRTGQQALRLRRTAPIFKLLGNALGALGQFAQAEAAYQEALRLQPGFAAVFANLGSLYAQQQRWERSIAAFRQALRLEPQFAGAYRNFAKVWEKLGDEVRSLECWHRALEIEPGWATVGEHVTLGNRWVKLGEVSKGERCYRRAIVCDGSSLEARYNLGVVLFQQGKLEAARAVLEEAFTANAASVMVLRALIEVVVGLEDWEAAIQYYGVLAGVAPQQVADQCGFAGVLRDRGLNEEAIGVYRRALEFAPDVFDLNVGLAEVLVELERWDEALKPTLNLVSEHPELAISNYWMGRVQIGIKRWKLAEAALRQSIDLDKTFFWSHYFLAKVLIALERWESVVDVLTEAMQLNPGFYWGYFDLGEALTRLGRYSKAITVFHHVEKINPKTPWISKKLGDLYRNISHLSTATKYYRLAIEEHPEDLESYHYALELNPSEAEFYIKLANELMQQQRSEEATVFYQIAVDLDPVTSSTFLASNKELNKVFTQNSSRFVFPGKMFKYKPLRSEIKYDSSYHLFSERPTESKKTDTHIIDFVDFYSPDSLQTSRKVYIDENTEFICSKLTKYVKDKNIKVVSFDVFDTFILRNNKAEAFRYYELSEQILKKIKSDHRFQSYSQDITIEDILTARETGMRLSYRTRMLSEGLCEGHIDEVHDIMCEYLFGDQSDGLSEILRQAEIDYEIKNTEVNSAFLVAAREMESQGIRIIFVSDMYLGSDHIREILRRKSKDLAIKFDDVFSSADTLSTKRSGTIFNEIEAKMNTVPECFLHIGDSFVGDVQRPLQAGWNSMHFPIPRNELIERQKSLTVFISMMAKQGVDVRDWAKA